jgi:hypothetical protein
MGKELATQIMTIRSEYKICVLDWLKVHCCDSMTCLDPKNLGRSSECLSYLGPRTIHGVQAEREDYVSLRLREGGGGENMIRAEER